MNNSLYKLADEYLAAAYKLADMDLEEQTVKDTLESLSGALEVKATNVAMFVRNLESLAEQIKAAEEQMAARRKAVQNRADRVREYLKMQMERTQITKIECPYFKIALRQNPAAVVIDDASIIPQEYWRVPPPPPPMPDTKAIAEALKTQMAVPGAHLERGTRVEIK